MIALKGFSRFPIFFSADGRSILGAESSDEEFNNYVESLTSISLKGTFIATRSFYDLQYKTRFVLKGKAINPELRKEEDVPRFVYIYPSKRPVDGFKNIFSKGITLKGGRKPVFFPLVPIRILSQKEVEALSGILEVRELDVNRLLLFLERLGIQIEVKNLLVNQRVVLRLTDPEVNRPYRVLIDEEGHVMDVDFCVDNYRHLYLPELVMFVRENRSVHLIGGFNY